MFKNSKPLQDNNTYKLYAPKSYWHSTAEERAKVCNGCGAKGGLPIPNTMYGLCIKEACQKHDWMYYVGKTLADKLFADAIFRMNISIIISAKSNWIMSPLRESRASKYYIAVEEWGDSAFWVDKKKNNDMFITYIGEFR